MGPAPRTEKLDLRISPEAKRRLTAAAAVAQRSVSDFVLTSALSKADETLADRQHFGLTAEQWSAFMTALDAPTRELPRARRLLNERGVFDTGTIE